MGRTKGQPSVLWTEQEEQTLRKHYNKIPIDELLLKLPGRTKGTIKVKAHKLGLTQSQPGRGFRYDQTETTQQYITQEVYRLRQAGGKWCSIANHLGYGKRTLTKKFDHDPNARQFDLYSEQEDQYIVDHWSSMTDQEIAVVLGRAETGVRYRRVKLGYRRSPVQNPWTPEEDQFIHNNVAHMTDRQMSDRLDRTPVAIRHRRQKLGYTRSQNDCQSLKTKQEQTCT